MIPIFPFIVDSLNSIYSIHAALQTPNKASLNPELATGMKSPESNYALAWKLAKDQRNVFSPL